jgi:glycosyltransferase involved in cell wall biosynthesis
MNIFIASHISDLSGPTEALVDYVRKRKYSYTAVLNPLEYCEIARRQIVQKIDGKTILQYATNIRRPALLSWIIDLIIVIYQGAIFPHQIDLFIGCDPLNSFAGVLMKKFGKVKKLVFYSIDWSENRFSNTVFNRIYYALDKYCLKNCDKNWCVAQNLIELRMKQGADISKITLVPVGLKRNNPPDGKHDKFILVFLGAMERTKGIELVINSWEKIHQEIPNCILKIIGKTPKGAKKVPYEEILSQKTNVYVLGVLSHDDVLTTIQNYGIGLAPYSDDKNSVTRFADPSRIKDYLATGLPVITTRIPSISKEIFDYNAGIIIDNSSTSLIKAIRKIQDNYTHYSYGSSILAKKYEWKNIFLRAISDSII